MKLVTQIHEVYGTVDFHYSIDRRSRTIIIESLSWWSDGSYNGSDYLFMSIGSNLHRFIVEWFTFDCRNMEWPMVEQFIKRFSWILRAYKIIKNVTDIIFTPDGIIES